MTNAERKRERYYRLKAEGKCPRCGNKKDPQDTHNYCKDCRDYATAMQFVYDSRPGQREEKRKKRKKCATRGKEEPVDGSFFVPNAFRAPNTTLKNTGKRLLYDRKTP